MLKKVLRSTVVAGAAIAATAGFASTAVAGPEIDVDVNAPELNAVPVADSVEIPAGFEVPDINALNNICALPWLWQGPFNIVNPDQNAYYSVCNGEVAVDELDQEGINVLNNICVAPWLWQGPFNIFNPGQNAYYEVCNVTVNDDESTES